MAGTCSAPSTAISAPPPLPFAAGDQDKVDAFVLAICNLTGHDLRPFFGPLGSGDQRRA